MNIIYYTHSRKMGPYIIPISIQSIYLKNYASAQSYPFSLSVTEYPAPSCYFSLIQRLSTFNSNQSINIICTTIFIFKELSRDSAAFNELSKYRLNIYCILEGFGGSLDAITGAIFDLEFINNLACHDF